MLIVAILLVAFLSTGVLSIIERINSTGQAYAEVTYAGQPMLKINLSNPEEYQVYDTQHKDKIDTELAEQGIFYVPGEITTNMSELYTSDAYARDNQIIGIKLLVENGKISVVYQESPRDTCQYEPPTDSYLDPIVCLPNKVVIRIITSQTENEFIIDDGLE